MSLCRIVRTHIIHGMIFNYWGVGERRHRLITNEHTSLICRGVWKCRRKRRQGRIHACMLIQHVLHLDASLLQSLGLLRQPPLFRPLPPCQYLPHARVAEELVLWAVTPHVLLRSEALPVLGIAADRAEVQDLGTGVLAEAARVRVLPPEAIHGRVPSYVDLLDENSRINNRAGGTPVCRVQVGGALRRRHVPLDFKLRFSLPLLLPLQRGHFPHERLFLLDPLGLRVQAKAVRECPEGLVVPILVPGNILGGEDRSDLALYLPPDRLILPSLLIPQHLVHVGIHRGVPLPGEEAHVSHTFGVHRLPLDPLPGLAVLTYIHRRLESRFISLLGDPLGVVGPPPKFHRAVHLDVPARRRGTELQPAGTLLALRVLEPRLVPVLVVLGVPAGLPFERLSCVGRAEHGLGHLVRTQLG
mmetsp:Transcript_35237/g.105260  ORF Transcript_35237/g.105260 Transcript_35237/m.105260 type:complete len:415 (+) Transcript_35237:651-1895(+)